jgi:hypothetical protein
MENWLKKQKKKPEELYRMVAEIEAVKGAETGAPASFLKDENIKKELLEKIESGEINTYGKMINYFDVLRNNTNK